MIELFFLAQDPVEEGMFHLHGAGWSWEVPLSAFAAAATVIVPAMLFIRKKVRAALKKIESAVPQATLDKACKGIDEKLESLRDRLLVKDTKDAEVEKKLETIFDLINSMRNRRD